MRRVMLLLVLATLTGCVSAGPDLSDGDPSYYDGGYYYAAPRPVDYDVEQRAYAGDAYWYPGLYPSLYGGYYDRYRYDHHDHHWHDGNHDVHPFPRGDVTAAQRTPVIGPLPPPVVGHASPESGFHGGGGGMRGGHR